MEYMNLHIIATGGTFEKHYDEITGELVFTSSHIPAMMERARVSQSYTFQELTMLDSLDMQDADRENILKSCREIPADRIVIVHGTDTMPGHGGGTGKSGT